MWAQIEEKFKSFPAQLKVARLLFERGFQVTEDGEVKSGGIKISNAGIAREAGVERKAVDRTVKTILSGPRLKKIFGNLRQVCLLEEVAPELGLSTLVVMPKDAYQKGVLAKVAQRISEQGLNIVQVFAEHPEMSPNPRIIAIIEGRIPLEVINELKKLPTIRRITV